MGQPITVVEKPSSRPGVARFETNRSLTGMGHERYRSEADITDDRPVDELARRMFATGGVQALHVNGSVITAELAEGWRGDRLLDVIRNLYIFYPAGGDTAGAGAEGAVAPPAPGGNGASAAPVGGAAPMAGASATGGATSGGAPAGGAPTGDAVAGGAPTGDAVAGGAGAGATTTGPSGAEAPGEAAEPADLEAEAEADLAKLEAELAAESEATTARDDEGGDPGTPGTPGTPGPGTPRP